MKDHEKQYFEDILVKAVQSGKKETSGLVADVTKKVTEAVKEQIILTVNGKIDKIKEHLERQDEKLLEMDEKIDDLKKETDPVIQDRKTISSMGKFVIWSAAIVASVLTISKLWK